MRICLISREYPPDTGWGGIATFSRHLAHGLTELGHDVVVVCLAKDDDKVVDDQGVSVHRVNPSILPGDLGTVSLCMPYSRYVLRTTLALWRKFFQLHASKPFDVVDTPELLAEGLYPAITRIAPLVIRLYTPHSKFISEQLHSVNGASFDHQFVAMLERVAMLSADVLTSPSEDLADFVACDLNYPRHKIHIVRNPIDPAEFSPDGPVALQKDDRLKVLFVGRLEERKGISYLIDAVPEVLREFPKTHFVVIGDDTNNAASGQHSVLFELKASLKRHGASDSVTFIPRVPLSALPDYYRSADICVVPSVYDNSPYTCLEAMACGKPVIGTSGGGTREYVLHGESGIIVPPKDSLALARAIKSLLAEPGERLTLATNARRAVLDRFQRKRIAEQTLELYELAALNFAARGKSLYLKEAGEAFPDAAAFLMSFDKMIYDTLYQQSWRFRIRHWWRIGTKRPRLFAGKLLLRVYRTYRGLVGRFERNNRPSPEFISWLEKEIADKQEEPLSKLLAASASSKGNKT